ncbi:MAG: hypothetical protein Kow0080_16500 [Candidatus Promineifilaceae bacterium]
MFSGVAWISGVGRGGGAVGAMMAVGTAVGVGMAIGRNPLKARIVAIASTMPHRRQADTKRQPPIMIHVFLFVLEEGVGVFIS